MVLSICDLYSTRIQLVILLYFYHIYIMQHYMHFTKPRRDNTYKICKVRLSLTIKAET